MILMLLFKKEWEILISTLYLTAVFVDRDASIYERVKGSN